MLRAMLLTSLRAIPWRVRNSGETLQRIPAPAVREQGVGCRWRYVPAGGAVANG